MLKKEWRLIISNPADAVENMAIDEAILLNKEKSKKSLPVLRLYSWDAPCVTIGYFQKYPEFTMHKMPVVRRLTGGLAVIHGEDVSYAIIADKNEWRYVYDQEKSYQFAHAAIKDALINIGIQTEFCMTKTPSIGRSRNMCVKTFYSYDLHKDTKKIAGSSQRRRGKIILQQGSIHLKNIANTNEFIEILALAFEDTLSVKMVKSGLLKEEIELMNTLMISKYSTCDWNKKY